TERCVDVDPAHGNPGPKARFLARREGQRPQMIPFPADDKPLRAQGLQGERLLSRALVPLRQGDDDFLFEQRLKHDVVHVGIFHQESQVQLTLFELAGQPVRAVLGDGDLEARIGLRSEEHTSELQSRENLVCRLLLEKKKNNKKLPNGNISPKSSLVL